MDHSNAHYIENSEEIQVLSSDFSHDYKEAFLHINEHTMHNKKNKQHNNYFKKIGEIIQKIRSSGNFWTNRCQIGIEKYSCRKSFIFRN